MITKRMAYVSDSVVPSRSANSLHVMKMCDEFIAHGWEVILITRKNRNETEKGIENIFKFYNLRNRFKIISIPCFNKLRGRDYLFGLLSAFIITFQKVEIVYGRSLFACYFSALIGYPVFIELHDLFRKNGGHSRIFRKLIRNRNFQHLIVTSHTLKHDILNLYDISTQQITVAHNGANFPTHSLAHNKRPIVDDHLQIGYTGHLYPGKGMEMIAALVPRCTFATFHIVGGTEDDIAYWKNKVSKYENIVFHGYVYPSDVHLYRENCDILLAPYQEAVKVVGNHETQGRWMTPIKLFEYMASGKAIIASALPVAKEVLEHKKTGWLCKPDDVDEWYQAIKALKEDSTLRNLMGINAYKKFKSTFSWEARAERIINDAILLCFNNKQQQKSSDT